MRTVLALCVVLMLSACATRLPDGVQVHEGDLERCKAETCTLWTDRELASIFNYLMMQQQELRRSPNL